VPAARGAILFVMRPRRLIFVTAAVAGVAGLLAVLVWPSRCPITVKLVNVEPAGVIDDAGLEMSLVTLAVSSCAEAVPSANHTLYLGNRRANVEAKVANRWVEVQDSFYLDRLAPGEESEVTLLLPAGTEICRLHLKYALASWKWRLAGLLARCGMRMSPKFYRWVGWPEGRNPRWSVTSVELSLAPRSARQASD
jgi:hypothetical protein